MSYGKNKTAREVDIVNTLRRHKIEPTVELVDDIMRICGEASREGYYAAGRASFRIGYNNGIKREQFEEVCRRGMAAVKERSDEY